MNDAQVLYQGRWVSKEHFAAFVYSKEGQKLAKSYEEYSQLISSGLWKSTIAETEEPKFEPIEQIEVKEEATQEPIKEEDNIVEIKAKRGRPCRNQLKQ